MTHQRKINLDEHAIEFAHYKNTNHFTILDEQGDRDSERVSKRALFLDSQNYGSQSIERYGAACSLLSGIYANQDGWQPTVTL